MLLEPQRLWAGGWQSWLAIHATSGDVGRWPHSVGALVNLASFLGTLRWPAEVANLGNGRGFPLLSFLFFVKGGLVRGFGWRFPNFAGLVAKFQCQLHTLALTLSVPCRFILGHIGANHGRLRHIGWEKSCHGLAGHGNHRRRFLK